MIDSTLHPTEFASTSSQLKRPRSRSPSGSDSDSYASDSSDDSSAWSDVVDDANWMSRTEQEKADLKRQSRLRREGQGRGAQARRARSVTPERITSATPLGEANLGMKMLKIMGWKAGQGLGANGTGRTEPIPLPDKMDSLGLGKANIETRMLDELLAKRTKTLESQRIANETEEQRAAREAEVAARANTTATVASTISKFLCDICSKQYANVSQWEEHLQSYGHNHAKRKKEVAMQSKANRNNADEVNKRREKERKREEKEMLRMVAAAGGKPAGGAGVAAEPAVSKPAPPTIAPEKKMGGFFKVAGSASGQSAPVTVPSTAPAPMSSRPLPPSFRPAGATATPPPPPASTSYAPPPPPSSDMLPAPPPPPPSIASGPPPPPSEAPTFTSSKTYLVSTWLPSSAAPGLHPLLAGEGSSTGYATPTSFKQQSREVRQNRNDLFAAPSSSKQYEAPTMASITNTARQPKGMTFVPSSSASKSAPASKTMQPEPQKPKGMSVAIGGGAAMKKKPLDMDMDEDEDDMLGMSKQAMPSGRPRAMPRPGGGRTGLNM